VVLILVGSVQFVETLSILNRLTAIEIKLTELPVEIGNQTDAKLEHLRADLMKEFYWRAKQAAKAGNLADAAANLKAAAILTDMATDGRVPVEPSFLKHAVTSLQEIEAQFPGPSRVAEPAYKANLALAAYRSAIAPVPAILG